MSQNLSLCHRFCIPPMKTSPGNRSVSGNYPLPAFNTLRRIFRAQSRKSIPPNCKYLLRFHACFHFAPLARNHDLIWEEGSIHEAPHRLIPYRSQVLKMKSVLTAALVAPIVSTSAFGEWSAQNSKVFKSREGEKKTRYFNSARANPFLTLPSFRTPPSSLSQSSACAVQSSSPTMCLLRPTTPSSGPSRRPSPWRSMPTTRTSPTRSLQLVPWLLMSGLSSLCVCFVFISTSLVHLR